MGASFVSCILGGEEVAMVEVFLKFGWLLFLGVAFFVLLVRLEKMFKRGDD